MWGYQRALSRLLLAAYLLAAAPAALCLERWAGLADPVFRSLTHDSELPNAAIPTAATQDGEGFLWIGSQNGLARWDGYHFRVYHAEPGQSGALPDNFIQTLFTDPRGDLWVGTTSGGLARYDREHDRFAVYPAGPHGLSHVSVRAITDDGAGGVWVATEGGLDHVPAAGAVEHLRHDPTDTNSLPDDRVRVVLRDRHGNLWVGVATGLARLAEGSRHFEHVDLPAATGKVASPWSFLEDSDGRIWVGTIRQGAYVVDPVTLSGQPLRETDTDTPTLDNEGVSSIVETRPGQVWLGTLGQGIVSVAAATMQTRRIRHDATQPSSLADDSIQGLYRDRSGLIWICSDRGIALHDPGSPGLLTVSGASSRSDGISDADVDAILPRPDGRIWLGLGSRGIDVIDPTGSRVASLRPDPRHPDTALPKDYINSFATSPASSDVFVGTESGLYRVDNALQGAARMSIPQRDPTAQVWALLVDDEVLWVGGFDGLWPLPLGSHASAISHVDTLNTLTDQRISAIARGDGQTLWIGTKNGLNRLDLKAHTIERILPDPADPQALAAGYITSVLTDMQGRVWVATFGGGVHLLESRDSSGRPRFRRIGIAQGLNNGNVDKLLEDAQHNIWVGTDDGLAVIDRRSLAVRSFRRGEGLPISMYWVGSGASTPQGELLFGGIGGLTVVRPALLDRWKFRPPVAVTEVHVGGKPVAAGDSGFRVSPAANSIAVEFAALDFSAPERNRYAYRLEGFDSGWVDTEAAHRVAMYTNLPPGRFTLHLRGSNRDGVWSQSELQVPINVLPAWYQSAWFRIACGIAGFGLIVALVQLRTLYLRRNQRDLERQVVERTAELRESQRQLTQIAYEDTLTALPNRRMFTERFRELLTAARLQRQHFGLLLIDLDRFKQINDSLGHDAGDALLIEAAIRLQAAVRKSDCVARTGGDEFAVLVSQNPAASDIEAVCQRIIEGFVMPILVKGAQVSCGASIGVATFPQHGASLDDLYKSADVALYEAKRAGGNRWRWYGGRHNQLSSDGSPTAAVTA